MFLPRLRALIDYDALAGVLAGGEEATTDAVAAYEEALRARLGAARVYALSSARGALALGLKLLGIGRGDDVAIPALTCSAVADAVLSLGAVPHLVDVAPRHFGIDPHSLRRVLARGRTRAIVTAPLFGVVPPAAEVAPLLAGHGVPLLEDIAQSFGSAAAGRPAGSTAPLAVLSTNYDKPYTTGRGGALVVNEPALVAKADELVARLAVQSGAAAETVLKGLLVTDGIFDGRRYRPFASVDLGYIYARAEGDAYDLRELVAEGPAAAARHALAAKAKLMPDEKPPFARRLIRGFFPRSAVPALGTTKRLAPLLAAVGSRHLETVAAEGERRRRLARLFDEAFASGEVVRGPRWGHAEDTPWPLRYPAFARVSDRRSEIIRRLAAAGYEAGPFIYPRPLSGQFPYYKLCRHTGRYLRGAWRAAAALINLPLHQGVGEEDVHRMVMAIHG